MFLNYSHFTEHSIKYINQLEKNGIFPKVKVLLPKLKLFVFSDTVHHYKYHKYHIEFRSGIIYYYSNPSRYLKFYILYLTVTNVGTATTDVLYVIYNTEIEQF